MNMLQEFEYGYGRLKTLLDRSSQEHPPKRFYENALIQAVCNFYLDGGRSLLLLLDEVGLEGHAARIRAILDSKLIPEGTTVFRQPLADYRNKYLNHPSFTHGELQKRRRDLYPDFAKPEATLRYRQLAMELYDETASLQGAMLKRFPQVIVHNRE